MPALLAALEQALIPLLKDRPFAFFGHSMGALLAFELIRGLRRHQGPQPVWLFASAAPAPNLRDPTPMHALPRKEFLERLRQMKGIPEEALAHKELLDMVLPTIQADFELEETREYVHEEPLDIPITALCGDQDDMVAFGDVEAWSLHTRSTFSTRRIPGNHFFIDARSDLVLDTIHETLRSGYFAAPRAPGPSR
jgi:surfactin synthase thioesterase subunit